jgi:hypothetical protein
MVLLIAATLLAVAVTTGGTLGEHPHRSTGAGDGSQVPSGVLHARRAGPGSHGTGQARVAGA